MEKSIIATPYIDMLRNLGLKITKEANVKLNKIGLNAQQGRMIGYIYENQNKGIIQKDLAEKYQLKGASISSMLKGLEKKGYVERIIPAENARQKNIYVLEKGANLVEEFNEIFSDVEAKLVKNLTIEEMELLKKLLVKVRNGLYELD
mgnify:CR=1 FL=1